jgi:predicted permease
MLLGWLSGKLGYTRREDANVLATVVIRFALPFHLFIGALNTDPGKIKNMTFMAVLVVGNGFVFTDVIYFTLCLSSRYQNQRHSVTGLCLPGYGLLWCPVLAVLIGPEGFIGVLIGNIITSVIMIPLTIVLIRMGDKNGDDSLNALHRALW